MRKYFWPVTLIVIALVIIFGGALVGLYTDWLWFQDLGYSTIFSTIFWTRVKLGLALGVLFFAIIYGNLWYARKIAPPPPPMGIEQQLMDRLGRLARRGIGVLLLLGSVIISAMVGLEAATHWEDWLKYANASSFGVEDPVFGRDIGFYVFKLPFLNYIYYWLWVALLGSAIAAAGLHYADEAIEVFGGRLQIAPKAKSHLAVLLAAMFFLKAWGYRLGMYELLFTQGGLINGAGFTEIHANLPALWILLVVAIFCGILVLLNIYRRGIVLAAGALVLLIVASVAVGGIYPALIQNFQVDPNELDKQTPYIERAIAATQQAYGLTQIEVQPFEAVPTLTAEEVEQNQTTLQNIRLWDQEHLLQAYAQTQNILQIYQFEDVDVDRYWLKPKNGGEPRYRQVWLSARELDQDSLPENSRTWVNTKLQYTHGYGYCMSPVNEVSSEGLPEFFVFDIPPKTTVDIPIEQMGVYFGELTNDYVFVDTTAAEFDRPATGEEGELTETNYKGEEGVGVGSFFRKLMFALRFSDVNILLNDNLTADTDILMRRNVTERMRDLFPFLQLDEDPYLVTVDGGLFWMQDAYTMTSRYPYSERVGRFNYIRNSVKLVANAYTGDVQAYVIQEPLKDPIIETYSKIFPGVFKSIEEMPEDLRAHIRYPEDFFRIQTVVYQRYHQTKATEFYNNSDLWRISGRANLTGSVEEEAEPMQPYYVIMNLPGGDREEFLLMTPFIRAGKFNMVSWMAARCDEPNYGKLILYQFPRDRNIFGPQQIAARARQDTVISQQITLWSQQGSTVGSGNLLVVPVESALLYVMPVYLVSTTTQIPELKRVIVALGDKISMQPTLEQALSDVVGEDVSLEPSIAADLRTASPGEPAAPAVRPGRAPTAEEPAEEPEEEPAVEEQQRRDLIRRANDQYEAAEEALEALKQTLDQLEDTSQ